VADGEPALLIEAAAPDPKAPSTAPDPKAPDPTAPYPKAPHSLLARATNRVLPHTFQGRLTLAFVAILALTLTLVTILVLNRLGNYFDQQQREDLTARSLGVAQYVALVAEGASTLDQEERREIYRQVVERILDATVYIPLYKRAVINAYLTRVEGEAGNPWDEFTWNVEEWSLSE